MAGDADLVFVGGKVFTSGRERPWARAFAVRGDRFAAVGTDAQAERWAGRRTRVVDLRDRVAVPGFIDAHAHMGDSAGEIGWTRLDGTRSRPVMCYWLESRPTFSQRDLFASA